MLRNTDSKYTILYHENVDIDGFRCRNDIANLIKSVGKKQTYLRAHEWCCGHGAIGFKLLEADICTHLVLTDIFEPAIEGCDLTVAANNIQNCVTTYCTDTLTSLPDSEKWDLFVANPPWRSKITSDVYPSSADEKRKMYDVNWALHNHMYNSMEKYLTDDAEIFLFEDTRYSSPDTWHEQIDIQGYQIINTYYDCLENFKTGYILHLDKKN